jgi:hypothetical protein
MSTRGRGGRIALVVLLLGAGRAGAEDRTTEGPSSAVESPRALNSHVFQPSRLLTGPFTDTAFGMATLAGGGNIEGPRYNLAGNQIGTRRYTLADFGQALNLDLRVTPDIALRFEVSVIAFSGTNAAGVLVAGMTAQTGATVGVTAGRNLNREMRLSFVADFGVQPQISILIANAVRSAVANRTFDDTGLLSNVKRLYGAPGLSFAWAPNPAFGLVAETRYVSTRRISSEGDDARISQGAIVGGLLSFDLEPLLRWPFGFQAIYRADIPLGSNGIIGVDQASLGVYYTRRVRLALGLEAIWRRGQVRPGVEPTLTANTGTAAINFRYYW